MYEKLEECPSCGHTSFNNHLICKDHLITDESFALVKCSKCQLVFTNPRPTIDNSGSYYQSDDYISHSNNGNSLINILYKLVREYTTRQKYIHISKYVKTGRLLDYGCGTGHFLSKSKDFANFGYDQDEKARQSAKEISKAQILPTTDAIKKEDSFNVITAWHVLEHVHDLKETMKLLKKKLAPSGYIFIALPNLASNDSKIYGSDWAAYDVPRHLYHFTQSSFVGLLKSLKLHLIEVLPMTFDAYYVCMLSEKNLKNGSILKGIRNGYYSNQKAKTTGNYSSLIYVISK